MTEEETPRVSIGASRRLNSLCDRYSLLEESSDQMAQIGHAVYVISEIAEIRREFPEVDAIDELSDALDVVASKARSYFPKHPEDSMFF